MDRYDSRRQGVLPLVVHQTLTAKLNYNHTHDGAVKNDLAIEH